MKKKNLFLSLMAGVALLGSCTREALSTSPDGYAVVPEGAIVFDTRVSGTKAVTETTASTLQTQGFNVYGLAVTTPLEGDPTFEEYMDNVTVSNHDGVYYGSTTYYWPAGKTMDFYCANAGKEISSTDGAATLAYTLDANREYDLVAAKSVGASSGTVSLTFAHLLSQLQLKVLGLDENATYTLTSLSVTAPTVGTYAFSRDGSDSWTLLGTDAAYSVYSGAGQAVSTSSAANIGTTMAFFPGTATVRAQWTCKVDDQVIGTYDNTAVVSLSKGKVNTVTLKLPNASAAPIAFSMSVNAWTNAEEAEVQMGPSATIAVSAAADETVTLPQMTLSSGTSMTIDWGDGSSDTYEYNVSRATIQTNGTVTPSHTYSEAISDRISLFVSGGEVDMMVSSAVAETINVISEDRVNVELEPDYSAMEYVIFRSYNSGNSMTIEANGQNEFEQPLSQARLAEILPSASFYYSVDGENYSPVTLGTPIEFDDKIYLKGKVNKTIEDEHCNALYFAYNDNENNIYDSAWYELSMSSNVSIEGNVMSILDYDNISASGEQVLIDGCEYWTNFFVNSKIVDAHNLALPNNLWEGFAAKMFKDCTELMVAPILSNLTLSRNCYSFMFQSCTSLSTAPVLPATTTADGCYDFMFSGCTSLSSVICLATDISSTSFPWIWLRNTAASGTFYKNPNATCWTVGENVPSGWTIQDYTE